MLDSTSCPALAIIIDITLTYDNNGNHGLTRLGRSYCPMEVLTRVMTSQLEKLARGRDEEVVLKWKLLFKNMCCLLSGKRDTMERIAKYCYYYLALVSVIIRDEIFKLFYGQPYSISTW